MNPPGSESTSFTIPRPLYDALAAIVPPQKWNDMFISMLAEDGTASAAGMITLQPAAANEVGVEMVLEKRDRQKLERMIGVLNDHIPDSRPKLTPRDMITNILTVHAFESLGDSREKLPACLSEKGTELYGALRAARKQKNADIDPSPSFVPATIAPGKRLNWSEGFSMLDIDYEEGSLEPVSDEAIHKALHLREEKQRFADALQAGLVKVRSGKSRL